MAKQSQGNIVPVLAAIILLWVSNSAVQVSAVRPAPAPYMRGYDPAHAPGAVSDGGPAYAPSYGAPEYAPSYTPSKASSSDSAEGSPMSAPVVASPAYDPSSGPSSHQGPSPAYALGPGMPGNCV